MKRTLLTCLALMLALALGACSDDDGSSTDTGQDETVSDLVQDEVTPDITVDDEVPDQPAEPDVVEDPVPDHDAVDTPAEEGTPGEGVVGDPCTTAEDCGGVPGSSKQCLTDIMSYIQFEGGYCTATCTTAAECGEGVANCVNLYIVSYCLKLCENNADCRMSEEYECAELPFMSDGNTYCIPQLGNLEGIDF